MNIPDDENGDVLRGMWEAGDSLKQPRIVDFCFCFTQREQMLGFAQSVSERDLEVCLSYYEERSMWQAIVKRHMVPEHAEITRIEHLLSQRAAAAGGEADGWGCMRIIDSNPG
jgi:hypothetical protein